VARAATREARDLAEPGANLAVAGREGLSLYLVDEAVEQEAGADEGEGEEDRDGHRLRAADPHHRRRRTDDLLPRWAAHPVVAHAPRTATNRDRTATAHATPAPDACARVDNVSGRGD